MGTKRGESQLKIEDVQRAVLDVAKVFHNLCVKNGFTYYLVGGGLIGAIRHKGFIPWDDDLDFYVPRKQFNDLVNTLRAELPQQYTIRSSYDDDFFWGETVKVERNDISVKESYGGGNFRYHGPFIDLFPMDFTDNSQRFFSRNKLIRQLLMVEVVRRRSSWVGKQFLVKLLAAILGKHFVKSAIRLLVEDRGNYCVNYWGAWGEKECVPKEVIGTPTLYAFEDTFLFGVEKYNEFLTHIYGNYMQMPPIEKQRTHLVLNP